MAKASFHELGSVCVAASVDHFTRLVYPVPDLVTFNAIKKLLEEDLIQYRKLGKFKKFPTKTKVEYERYVESKNDALVMFTEERLKKDKGGKK